MGQDRQEPIGVVGLGMMGGGIARHALDAGFEVHGFDVAAAPRDRFRAAGGHPAASPAQVAERARLVLTSLPSVGAFREVVSGAQGLARAVSADHIVAETSTLPLAEKLWAREVLGEASVLDCTLSGTGGQMRTKDVVVYGSGEPAALNRVRPALATFSRAVYDVGAFGNGSRLKFIANHLVTIHNVAAAEALVLAKAAGLDLATVLRAVTDGAGTSRMLEVRGPMMVADDFSDATMRVDTYLKDVDIIGAFARDLHCPVPLFATSAQFYDAALRQGLAGMDTASVFAVLDRLAGRSNGQPGEG